MRGLWLTNKAVELNSHGMTPRDYKMNETKRNQCGFWTSRGEYKVGWSYIDLPAANATGRHALRSATLRKTSHSFTIFELFHNYDQLFRRFSNLRDGGSGANKEDHGWGVIVLIDLHSSTQLPRLPVNTHFSESFSRLFWDSFVLTDWRYDQ